MSPQIPVSIDDLSTERVDLDESISYKVVCRAAKVSEEPDKNGNYFLTGMTYEVMEPEDWAGRRIFQNYVPIPPPMEPGMTVGQRRHIEDQGVDLARLIKGLKVPYDASGFDPENIIGCQGECTVRNEEYQGRKMPRVGDWLL